MTASHRVCRSDTPCAHHSKPEATAPDMIRELVTAYSTHEWVKQPHRGDDGVYRTARRLHTVHHQPLLDQVEQTVTGSTTAGEVFHAAYGSKPAGRIDCLTFLGRIEGQSREMAVVYGIPLQPLRPRLLAIAGAVGDKPDRRVKSWWTTARILTQHEGPPYSPDVPCPQETCERWGTIRVRMDPNMAVCVECGHTWSDDDGTFGRLAVWADWAATHLRGPRHWISDVEVTGYVTRYGYDERLGYDDVFDYRVICPECEVERAAMGKRNQARAAAGKDRHAARVSVSHEVA